MEENKCEKCDKNFTIAEALEMHIKAKHPEDIKEPFLTPEKKKKIRNWGIVIIVIVAIGFTFYFLSISIKTLPPTDFRGHIEVSPPSHILKEPMDIQVQRHMLEHADGNQNGPGGIIINYNCIDHDCESDLIEELEAFAEKYPANVYVAPFPKMSVKIALTRQGNIVTLDNYDVTAIEDFIQG